MLKSIQDELAHSKAKSKKQGRPPKASISDQQEIISRQAQDATVSKVASDFVTA
jgi:hypothetical protein